jgi:protein-S-isoprenylcysteine O-methyltransferase Ste14
LIGTGPYRWIRHPIYTGILLGLAGTALVVGEVRGLVGLAVAAAAFYRKARKEETWLNQEFGASFEAHAKQTGMFLPRFL